MLTIIEASLMHHWVGAATTNHFCCDKSVLVMTKLLLPQIFIAVNTCLSQQKFCCDQHTFLATKDVFCHEKIMFVTINICNDKSFVMTKICLS